MRNFKGSSINRKKRCAPTRNSPFHRFLGGLTQGQGVCAAGWLSHSHSFVQRGPISNHIVHRFASEVIPYRVTLVFDDGTQPHHWYLSSSSSTPSLRCCMCGYLCVRLIILEYDGVRLCESLNSNHIPEESSASYLETTILHTDEFYQ